MAVSNRDFRKLALMAREIREEDLGSRQIEVIAEVKFGVSWD
jgi:hypothetical protein